MVSESKLFQTQLETFHDPSPYSFTVERKDSETLALLYSQTSDSFYQLQISSAKISAFVDRSILKEVNIYLVTPYNPVFLLLHVFE